jgi:hypothetical protein
MEVEGRHPEVLARSDSLEGRHGRGLINIADFSERFGVV